MTFPEFLRSQLDRLGTAKAAELCGVTPRSIQLWIANPDKPPCAAMQVGVRQILSSASPKKRRAVT